MVCLPEQVSQQRTQYRYWIGGDTSSLSREKIRALKELGFAWNGRASGSADAMVGKAGTKRALATPGLGSEKRGRTSQFEEEQDNLQKEMEEIQAQLLAAQSELGETRSESDKMRKQLLDIKTSLAGVISALGY
mmetsp:Transcript_14452/g.42354  ORF Transcript_14452/g.42354 Transcript_14452/m.42354 type:complete len:134 (+) Transcript_14452:1885-2286(+)